MKKYTRKALIRYFEKLPPRSRPCKEACPIATFMGPEFINNYDSPEQASTEAQFLDPALADCIDYSRYICDEPNIWRRFTAASIVSIAKAKQRPEKIA